MLVVVGVVAKLLDWPKHAGTPARWLQGRGLQPTGALARPNVTYLASRHTIQSPPLNGAGRLARPS